MLIKLNIDENKTSDCDFLEALNFLKKTTGHSTNSKAVYFAVYNYVNLVKKLEDSKNSFDDILKKMNNLERKNEILLSSIHNVISQVNDFSNSKRKL